MLLVDTNIILDVLTDDPNWAEWSIATLEENESAGLAINPAIYAELSYGFGSSDEVDATIRQFGLTYTETPRDGLYRASQAFRKYKARGGGRNFVLPDFFIGGHAESVTSGIMTRDVKRYQTYFSSVPLICP